MTGLNLATFLRLLRADLGAWASLGAVALILAVMTWTTWGSRRALRKCLVLSIAAHLGLILYGSTSPAVLRALRLGADDREPAAPRPAERVRVMPVEAPRSPAGPDGRPKRAVAAWDRDPGPLAMAEPARAAPPPPLGPAPTPTRAEPTPDAPEPVAPEVAAPLPPAVEPAPPVESRAPDPPPAVAPGDPSEVAPAPSPVELAPPTAPDPSPIPGPAGLRARSRPAQAARPEPRPGDLGASAARDPLPLPTATPEPVAPTPGPRPGPSRPPTASRPIDEAPVVAQEEAAPPAPAMVAPTPSVPSPGDALPGVEVRRSPRPARVPTDPSPLIPPRRVPDDSAPPAMARATPAGPSTPLPTAPRSTGRRALAEVPPVYRSRLDPNRASLAQRAGASVASEQAVERALDWLARHQDLDGRWDGGTSRFRDGSVAGDDDSYTIHCPAGDLCAGECYYPEADTALTGLSLLAYLGAGYTHTEGKYARAVGNGIEFLRRAQKPDGDLRGSSLAVGMYCHSMATLALCEAYALTGDPALRDPVERAVAFLVRARSATGLAWRYTPGAPDSDTSILGWAVMALKSAKTVGIPIPGPTQAGILDWLKKVAAGRENGLARYQPGDKVTPTMTAEAWACRQFLEVGGPGRASDEAAAFLVDSPTDGGGEFNIYYLYYGTLAMYQHGGEPWSGWNARVRDRVVARQQLKGHRAGSWDPDDSRYGTHGGRIYGTALATLTLEVYYRFLRLYEPTPAAPMAPRPADPATRRANLGPAPPAR